jgi:hypothetical protein
MTLRKLVGGLEIARLRLARFDGHDRAAALLFFAVEVSPPALLVRSQQGT